MVLDLVIELPADAPLNPTITEGAYSANDVVGGLLEFPINSGGSGGGILNHVRLTDADNVKAELDLYLFNEQPTAILDNAAFAPVIADLQAQVIHIDIPAADWETENSLAWVLAYPEKITEFYAPKGYLWGYLVDPTGETWTNADAISIRLIVDTQ